MKSIFSHYFRPSDEALKDLWANCIFAFDASVLLNTYGYSKDAAEELLAWLERIQERVRLPYQFGLEFSRSRPRVILKQVNNYNEAEDHCKKLQQLFDVKREHPFLSKNAEKAFKKVVDELREGRKKVDSLIRIDPYAQRILAVFDGRVGPAPSEADLKQMYDVAKARFEQQRPPGYADTRDKSAPDCYADYIGWRQLMNIAKKESKSVILVCDDLKADWWQYEGKNEREIGPRPELIAEFESECETALYLYQSDNFVFNANKFVGASISDKTIEEIRASLESQRETVAGSLHAKGDGQKTQGLMGVITIENQLKGYSSDAPEKPLKRAAPTDSGDVPKREA